MRNALKAGVQTRYGFPGDNERPNGRSAQGRPRQSSFAVNAMLLRIRRKLKAEFAMFK
jgi:hypothetical protein